MRKIIRQILTSRVYEAAVETALDEAVALSARTGNTILLKREDQQPIFSFKLRGAYNRIANLGEEERGRGVIAASAPPVTMTSASPVCTRRNASPSAWAEDAHAETVQ